MSDMTEVEPGLCLSGHLPLILAMVHGRPIMLDALPDGIDVVVSLRIEHHNVIPDPRLVASMTFPLDDTPEAKPTLDWLCAVVSCIESWRSVGKRVLVHCALGISRSGMVAVACLMKKNLWKADKAMEYVCERRPQVCPNVGFARLLREYETFLLHRNLDI